MDKDTLMNLFNELERQKKSKIDYITPSQNIQTIYDIGTNSYHIKLSEQNDTFEITDNCHSQISQKTTIPYQYYNRIKESHPELLLNSINTLLHDKDKLMLRTLDNKARALLSNRYRPIDNYDVMKCTLENLQHVQNRKNIQNINIHESKLTDTHLYIKITSQDLTGTINTDKTQLHVGDKVNGGIIITNSETGNGRFKVTPFMSVLTCSNGMISDKALSRVHLGKAQDEQRIEWSDHTQELEDLALYSRIGDMVQQTFDKNIFNKWVDQINENATNEIEQPIKAVNHTVQEYNLPKNSAEELLSKFANYGYTQWGLAQSITEYAHQQNNYETQIELEKIGNDIMMKPLVIK